MTGSATGTATNRPAVVFLSYSALDRTFANWLADSLRENNLRVWFSEWELDAGASFVKSIEDGVSQADYLVVILSRNSLASEWVRREIELATVIEVERKRNDFIVPARLDDCVAPLGLRAKHYADFRLDRDVGLDQLLRRLTRVSGPEVDPWIVKFQRACFKDYQDWKSSTFLRGYADVLVNPNSIFVAPEEQELISGRQRFERYNIAQAVEEFPSVLILGDPGAGKTTALRELSVRYLSLNLHGHRFLPLYVPITAPPEGDQGSPIVQRLLRETFRRLDDGWSFGPETIKEVLEQHSFLFLFDGLNEIPEALIPAYCADLQQFVQKQEGGRSRVVLASRLDNISRYKQSVRKITRNIFEVQKLTSEARIEGFVEKYMPVVSVRRDFMMELGQKPAAKQMAESPLLLAAMTLVYEVDGQLPNSRSLLLKRLVMVLLGEREEGARPLDTQLRHSLLAHLAFTLRNTGRGLGATRDEVVRIVQDGFERLQERGAPEAFTAGPADIPTIIEDCVRHRLLSRTHPGIRFWLEVVQEYFAACAVLADLQLVYGPDVGGASRADSRARLKRLVSDADWHQVLAIATGFVDLHVCERFVNAVKRRQPLLAASCATGHEDLPIAHLAEDLSNRVTFFFRVSAVLYWVNVLLSVAILLPLVSWTLPWMSAIARKSVIFIHERTGFGLPAYVVILLATLTVAGYLPEYWFRLLDSTQSSVLERGLPDRYVQPLLRGLVILRAEWTLSSLETIASRQKQLPKRLRAYVARANAVWRFREENLTQLRDWLTDEAMADYAIDRLGQLGRPEAIEWLLNAVGNLPPHSATHAVESVGRIARERDPAEIGWVGRALRSLVEARDRFSYRTRDAAYRVWLDLGHAKDTLRRPRRWDGIIAGRHPLVMAAAVLVFVAFAFALVTSAFKG